MVRELFHGATGNEILSILRSRSMRPNASGELFFSERRFESVLMHGGDMKRRMTFAIKVRIHLHENVHVERNVTQGVQDTFVIKTATPVHAEVLELFVRRPRGETVEIVRGAHDIERFLLHP